MTDGNGANCAAAIIKKKRDVETWPSKRVTRVPSIHIHEP